MPDSFVHLHTHTEFSMLDGAARVTDVVASAVKDGQPGIGISDHGNMYGVLDLYKEAKKKGIVPVIGTELYMAGESRHERPLSQKGKLDLDGDTAGKDKTNFHLTVFAETTQGYKNLMKLSSEAFLDGFYIKPRIDWELLEQYHEGIIAFTGCLGGQVLQALLKDDQERAEKIASRLQDIFGRDNLFVELQDHGIPEQIRTNPMLINLAKRINAPLVATNDSHYTNASDASAHDTLLCLQTGSRIDDPNRFKFSNDQHWLKTAAEMRYLFREVPQACDNTLWIVERSNVEIEFGKPQLPNFEIPEGFTTDSYLRHLTLEGAKGRYGDPIPPHVMDRLDFELGAISRMGFSAYFLIVWDLYRYAYERGIRVGPGRGSAAGSCVSYSLKIAGIDPLKFDLLFERFLNPGRIQMPDIDMDFDSRYRGEMIQYAVNKYGWDHVAQIVTFSTIKARAAVRDASRILGLPYGVGDRAAKAMPPLLMGRDTPLSACFEKTKGYEAGYENAANLRELYNTDPEIREVVDIAKGLEGLRRQDGIHAAAVVITANPLTEYLPIQRKPIKGEKRGERILGPIVTQYEAHGVEELGLLKMDFLGLTTLDVIDMALELIKENTGEDVDIDNIPLDDDETLSMLRLGNSIGVFQLEGGQMRALMRSLAPTSFDDIAALVALYRPGPMGDNMHNDYADRKNGRKPIEFVHPDQEEILSDTQGLMIYQEGMMRVAQKFAGYSLEQADSLRKATGKKIREIMAAERDQFVRGCSDTGYGEELGTKLFDIIEPFADYSFNRSHAYGYGFIAYQTAWLKRHYPAYFLAALLTSAKDDKDKTAVYLAECRRMGIEVLVPNINLSRVLFSVTDDTIAFGLAAVRNVGEGVSEVIVNEQANGPFKDFFDFCNRVDVTALNKKTIEALIKAGAFDHMHTRKGLSDSFMEIMSVAQSRRKKENAGQFDLFSSMTEDAPKYETVISTEEFERLDKLAFEKDMLGMYISDHPLREFEGYIKAHTDMTILELREAGEEFGDEGLHWVAGIISGFTKRYTKKGDLMATFMLEDMESATEVIVFPKTMKSFGHLLDNDGMILLKGRLDTRDENSKVFCQEIKKLDPTMIGEAAPLFVTLPADLGSDKIQAFKQVLYQHKGNSPVMVTMGEKSFALPKEFNVNPTVELYEELHATSF